MASRVAEFRIPPGWTRIELREKVLNFYSSVGEDDSKELAARLLMYAESRTACLLYAPPSPGSTSTLAEVLHYLCVPGAKSGLTNEVGGCFISVPTEMVAPFDASLRPHMAGDFVYIAKAVSQSTRFKHASLQSGNLQNNMNAVRNKLCAVVGTEPPYDRVAVQLVTDPTVSGATPRPCK